MAASGFSLEAVKNFMIENDCKVTNHELVTYFKSYLNDPDEKCKFLFMNFLRDLTMSEYFSREVYTYLISPSLCYSVILRLLFVCNKVYGTMLRSKMIRFHIWQEYSTISQYGKYVTQLQMKSDQCNNHPS